MLHKREIRLPNLFSTKDQGRPTFLAKALNLQHVKLKNVILVTGMNEELFGTEVKVHPIPHYPWYEIQQFPWLISFFLLFKAENEKVLRAIMHTSSGGLILVGQMPFLGSCLSPGLHNAQVGVSVTRPRRERHTWVASFSTNSFNTRMSSVSCTNLKLQL